MAIVLANESKANLIEQERPFLNTCSLRLFSQDFQPVAGMTMADFTPPIADTGFGKVFPLVFDPAILNAQEQGELSGTRLTWTATYDDGPFIVYGYVVYYSASNTVVYADRAADPFSVDGPEMIYYVDPLKVMDTMPPALFRGASGLSLPLNPFRRTQV